MEGSWRTSLRPHVLWHGLIAVLGAAGGAINMVTYNALTEHWSDVAPWPIIGGALHGAVLACITHLGAELMYRRPRWALLPGLPILGWLGGWLSWSMIGFGFDSKHDLNRFGRAFLWSFQPGFKTDLSVLWAPLLYFGGVVVIACALLVFGRLPLARKPWLHLPVAIAAGIAGSLPFWVALFTRSWFLSLLHGSTWGALIGIGLAGAARAAPTGVAPLSRSPSP